MNADIVFVDVTVRCTSDGCRNKNFDISVSAAVGGNIVCGPCGTELVSTVEAL